MIDRLARTWKELRRGQAIYALHVAALLMPGTKIPSLEAHQAQPQSLEGWTDSELELMIEEGRRQVDRQLDDLDRTRARAQWLFTLGVAALGALGAGFIETAPDAGGSAAWIIGMVILTWGLGGAAAIMVVRAEFRYIDTALLSSTPRPVLRNLADAYARMTRLGENSIATRITMFRQAVLFMLIGGYVSLIAALVS
jgi:hypothetical protein